MKNWWSLYSTTRRIFLHRGNVKEDKMIYKRDEGVSFLILVGCWYQDVRQFNLNYSLNPDIPSEITFLTMTIIFNKIRIKKNIYSS